jgi:hypothetical protein
MIKKLKISIFICILFLKASYGQCTADAGEKITVCFHEAHSEFILGGDPSAAGGTPDYTYKWQCKYIVNIGDIEYTYDASSLLDDISSANPQLLYNGKVDAGDSIVFYLIVKDQADIECKDSVVVYFCYFTMISHFPIVINQGEITTLYASVSGSCPPFEFYWEPTNYQIV